jgi:hypothetical protein
MVAHGATIAHPPRQHVPVLFPRASASRIRSVSIPTLFRTYSVSFLHLFHIFSVSHRFRIFPLTRRYHFRIYSVFIPCLPLRQHVLDALAYIHDMGCCHQAIPPTPPSRTPHPAP